MELFSVVTVDQARELITAKDPQPCSGSEELDLLNAVNRRLAEDVWAPEDLPPFSRSTVDGYAVRARDTFGATEGMPGFLSLCGQIEMGKPAPMLIEPGTASWIPTGGMLPKGADAVVMVEHTEEVCSGLITVHRPVTVGENVIAQGEDCAKGKIVLVQGTRLRSAEIGLLAGLGITGVKVFASTRVGIISTGDEIVPPDRSPKPGEIRDVNSYALAAEVIQCGGIPICYGIAGDDRHCLEELLAKALGESDLVLISGGSSVGIRDMTANVLSEGQPGILFHGVAIRPGKPTIGAMLEGKLVFGLPGHPASALVVFHTLVKPLLEWGSYAVAAAQQDFAVPAELSQSLSSGPSREDYIRVKLLTNQDKVVAQPILGKSGLISTLVESNGIIRIPLTAEGLGGGSKVDVNKL